MAVPKSKTSKSKRGNRRSHNALKPVCYLFDKTSGSVKLPHQLSVDGYYNGIQMIKPKKKNKDSNRDQPL